MFHLNEQMQELFDIIIGPQDGIMLSSMSEGLEPG